MRIRSSQQGLTLIEVLVAISILAVILGVVYGSFFSATKSSKLLESNEDVFQTARSLLDMLSRELRGLSLNNNTQALNGSHLEADGDPIDKIYFLTTSYPRDQRNLKENGVAEIGYFFDVDAVTGVKRLIKSVDTTPDNDITTGGKFFILTDRVKSLKVSYFEKKKDTWSTQWEQSYPPDSIRVKLSILDDQEQAVPFRAVIRPNVES